MANRGKREPKARKKKFFVRMDESGSTRGKRFRGRGRHTRIERITPPAEVSVHI